MPKKVQKEITNLYAQVRQIKLGSQCEVLFLTVFGMTL